MSIRRQATRAAFALGTSIALITGIATASPAATGSLTYKDAQGVEHQKVNPADGVCLSFEFPAVRVGNGTGTDAALYLDRECTQFLITVRKGTALVFGESRPQSIWFG
ncbi:hypothetical protein ACFQ2B_33590 [Streptomyces stramineus]|uniref:Uncharacterized protein n=1 Tax=Streptomyces stramineus TaxID=173861 RepID=A0ABN0ZVR0_9ACTN